MEKLRLSQLPVSAKIAMAATFYNSFVLFEELVIDRGGWYRYLPWYKYHQFCAFPVRATRRVARTGCLRRSELHSKKTFCAAKVRLVPFQLIEAEYPTIVLPTNVRDAADGK